MFLFLNFHIVFIYLWLAYPYLILRVRWLEAGSKNKSIEIPLRLHDAKTTSADDCASSGFRIDSTTIAILISFNRRWRFGRFDHFQVSYLMYVITLLIFILTTNLTFKLTASVRRHFLYSIDYFKLRLVVKCSSRGLRVFKFNLKKIKTWQKYDIFHANVV